MAQTIGRELDAIENQMRGLVGPPSTGLPSSHLSHQTWFGANIPNRNFGHTHRGAFLGAIPNCVKGKLVATDFIHFKAPMNFPYGDYCVWLETITNNGGVYKGGEYFKNLGKMNSWGLNKDYSVTLQLPDMHFGPYAKLFIIPDQETMASGHPYPKFIGTLRRGGTYNIDAYAFEAAQQNPGGYINVNGGGGKY